MIQQVKVISKTISKTRSKVIFISLAVIFIVICFCEIVRNDYSIFTQDPESGVNNRFASMCSSKSDKRGLHQNVIAFSVYGNFSQPNQYARYVEPIKNTIENISRLYPGTWTIGIIEGFPTLFQVVHLKNWKQLKNLKKIWKTEKSWKNWKKLKFWRK